MFLTISNLLRGLKIQLSKEFTLPWHSFSIFRACPPPLVVAGRYDQWGTLRPVGDFIIANMNVTTTEDPINPTLLDRLLKEGSVRSFAAGTVVIEEHDYIKNVPIVMSGSVKVFKLDDDGGEILLYYIKPGESCVMSFLGAACNGTSRIRAIVEEQAEILMLPVPKAIALIRDNPAWLEFIFQLYNKRFDELLNVINAVVFQNMDDRLWQYLKTKVSMLRTHELNITHQQIADELNTAREVVSRLLKKLEKDNKISLSRNKIRLRHPDGYRDQPDAS